MSGTKSKVISEINLEEFERRLRAAGAPQSGVEDPLSELTRLVNTIAAERPRGEKVVDIASARMPRADRFPPPAPDVVDEAQTPLRAPESVPLASAEPVVRESAPLLRASFAEAITPTIRRGGFEEATVVAETPEENPHSSEYYVQAPDVGEPASYARPARARSWFLKVGGLTALALLMGGGAVALKMGVPGLHKSPPLILAVDGPSKVAPPNETTVQSAGDSGALLLKDSAAPAAAPVKLVSSEEQPVDLGAQTPAPQPAASLPPPADAVKLASAPNTPIVAPSEGQSGAPASAPTLFPSAKPVRTVSVRPDGTLISADTTLDVPAAQSPAPVPTSASSPPVRKVDNSGAAALAATPTVDLAPKPSTLEIAPKPKPKSSARVNVAKADATTAADSGSAPLQLGSSSHGDKLPTKLAKPKPAPAVADATPAADAAGANATPTFETASAGGGWAVQLAAPRSESEAQGDVSRLQKKFSGDLGSTPLVVHKAEVKGETIYRVRATGLSKSDAVALCAKLKASGGDCFPARN